MDSEDDVLGRDHDHVVETTEFDELPTNSLLPSLTFDGASDQRYPDGSSSGPRSANTVPNAFHLGRSQPSNNFRNAFPPSEPRSFIDGPSSRRESRSVTPSHQVFVRIPPSKYKPLPYATGRSGLVYDVRMRFHANSEEPDHPENPKRVAVIFNTLVEAGLAPDPAHPEDESEFQLVRITIRPATPAEVLLCHSQKHLDWVRTSAGLSEDQLKEHIKVYKEDSVYVNNLTWLSAILSAGGAIEATKAVVAGQVRNSIAIIRPPGHHAEHDTPGGFCFFNNVCIAARIAQRDYPDTVRKVLILDWDVHHGNGIQRDFYNDPNVLYISLHVHQNGTFYPLGDYGDRFHCGEGPGRGRNVNIPWSYNHMGDGDYIYAFQEVVMPIAVEFDPDLVFISAGFDAADGDPLGDCHVSPACYGHMTHMLMQLAKGKIVSCLEGGYNLDSIAKSALSMTRVMMGEPPDRMTELQPTRSGVRDVAQVVRQQAKFWKSMYPKFRQAQAKKELGSQRMHDIVRDWQAQTLWNEHKMFNMFVLRYKLSKSYENQVLATENYRDARPLVVLFHDPPEAEGQPDPQTGELQLHNIFLTDVTKKYVDWAVKQDFAVIDANIPKHYTKPNDDGDYQAGATEDHGDSDNEDERKERVAQVRELALYLWQNYIEPWDATHIILMGTGDSYNGLVKFLANHPDVIDRVSCVIGFVGADYGLSGIAKDADPASINAFHRRSMIFVSEEHPAFDPNTKPLRKRYGTLIQSPQDRLQDIMSYHQPQVEERLLDLTAVWRDSRDTLSGAAMLNGTLDSDVEQELTDELDEMDVSHDHPIVGRYY